MRGSSRASLSRWTLVPVIGFSVALAAAAGQSTTMTAADGVLDKPRLDRYTQSEGPYQATLVVNDRRRLLSLSITARPEGVTARPGRVEPLTMDRRLAMWRPLLDRLF